MQYAPYTQTTFNVIHAHQPHSVRHQIDGMHQHIQLNLWKYQENKVSHVKLMSKNFIAISFLRRKFGTFLLSCWYWKWCEFLIAKIVYSTFKHLCRCHACDVNRHMSRCRCLFTLFLPIRLQKWIHGKLYLRKPELEFIAWKRWCVPFYQTYQTRLHISPKFE